MKARKRFIFEKKKQKTFVHLGQGRFNIPAPDSQKFFAPLFYKKAAAFSLLDQIYPA
jgi:hypothetical protein